MKVGRIILNKTNGQFWKNKISTEKKFTIALCTIIKNVHKEFKYHETTIGFNKRIKKRKKIPKKLPPFL